ncbi:MAG: DUF1015 domain-containing protein [Candidatus Aminicenantia bacterium]
MAIIKPFRAIRYNPEKIPLNEVITEPYDRITPEMQEDYYKRNPYNIVRIILGKDDEPHPEKNKYKRAKIYIDQWLNEGVFLREDKKSLYIYQQKFEFDGEEKVRNGLIGAVKLEEFETKKVLPHEKTFPKPKEDRFNLLTATNINTEQIFLLYNDEDGRLQKLLETAMQISQKAFSVEDEDRITHTLLILSDDEKINEIQKILAPKTLIIADGHHRYETSLLYKKQNEKKRKSDEEPFDYIMMTLFALQDKNLAILPTHRLVKGLKNLDFTFEKLLYPYFRIEEKREPESESEWLNIGELIRGEKHSFLAYFPNFKRIFKLTLQEESDWIEQMEKEKSKEWKSLDVSILHSLIFAKMSHLFEGGFSAERNVGYIRKILNGVKEVKEGKYQGIFILNPVELEEIKRVVENGELMPEKSTDFYPKLKSGILMFPLDEI